MTRIWSIASADFLERSRRFSFLAMIALSLFGAYWFVPRAGGYMQVIVIEPAIFMQGGHPSWIPLASAWGIGFFLPLLGFFYLSNSLAFDEKTGVKQLITSSSTNDFSYLLGKFISHILLLYCIIAAVFLGSTLMMILRFPGQFISLYSLITPYLYLVAAVTFISTIAILFESTHFLRGSIGAIAYVALFLFIFYHAMDRLQIEAGQHIWVKIIDFTGCSIFFQNVLHEVLEQSGQHLRVLKFLGSSEKVGNEILVFHGIVWTKEDILCQFGMVVLSLGLVGIAVPIYGTAGNMKRLPKRKKNYQEQRQEQSAIPIDLSAYIPRKIPAKSRIWGGIIAEMKLMLSGFPLIWWLISAVGFVSCILLPLETAQGLLPILLVWLISVFSQMGCREYLNDTFKCIAVLPKGSLRQILFTWVSGFLISVIMLCPAIIRMALFGQYLGVFACLSGIVFIPSMAIFLGEWTQTRRAFEVVYIIIAYLALNDVSEFMYLATQPEVLSFSRALVYLILGLVMGLLAIIKRTRIIQKISNKHYNTAKA